MRSSGMLLLFCFVFCLNCIAQEKPKFDWKTFNFSESGIAATLPCEPRKSVTPSETEPKTPRLYFYECAKDSFYFGIMLDERAESFSPDDAKKSFDSTEKSLRQSIDDKTTLVVKDFAFQNFEAREFTAEDEEFLSKMLLFQNKRGFYSITVRTDKETSDPQNKLNQTFQNISRQFFDSVKITADE